MVNVKNLFGMAVMATALVGCSSNDNLAPDGKDNVGKTGEAYASFTINLPTTSGTRADEPGTPSFENGDKNEYAVKDATLLLFQKNADGDFVFKEFVDLGNMEPWTSSKPGGGDITTTAKLTAKITKAEVGANKGYYALIVLNNNSETAAKITYPTEGQTYAVWSKNAANATAANYLKYDNGFFMANAPKYVAGAPETLVEIKNIYASKQQAENSTATTVYVERGLAKVSLASSSVEHVDIKDGNYAGDKVDITGWTLDVTNTKTYPVHVTEGEGLWADTWKTTATTAATNGASMDRFHDTKVTSEFPRVYWGLDPNYSTNFADVTACEKEFKMATKENFKTGDEAKKAQYCLENTFDIAHMMQGQTTRVLFSAKYTPANFKAGETFYKFGNSPKLWHATDVVAQIKAKALEVLGEADADKVTVTLAAEGNDMTKSGVRLVAAANISHGETALKDEQVDQINAKLGLKKATATDAAVGLSTFESGVSYYIARVKHFNDLTPWKPGDKTYDGNNANWLGRYGVLRNNWYELSVSSVSGPGYPDIPKVNPTDPDDVNDQYINVEVKILKWAKRSQQVEL